MTEDNGREECVGVGGSLPGGVPPPYRHSGADALPVEQESSRYRAPDHRQDPDAPLGRQDPWEAAGHFFLILFLFKRCPKIKKKKKNQEW